MIRIEHVEKSYGKRPVLKDVSLEVPTGSVTVIIGPSGSGKTTFLRTINFLGPADKGTLQLDEEPIIDMKRASKKEILHVRRNTAMVFQLYNLFSNMTVLQNVMEGLVTVQKMAKKEAREKAIACLQQVGMAEYLNAYPIQLSGGQQQRVGIARALAMNPKVILFDEPTSALDPEIVGEVLSVIREIASKLKITMIIVTHEIAFAREVADQVVFMENGYIVERGSAQEVLVHPKEKRTRQFLSRFLAPKCLSCDEMDPKKEAALWLNTAS